MWAAFKCDIQWIGNPRNVDTAAGHDEDKDSIAKCGCGRKHRVGRNSMITWGNTEEEKERFRVDEMIMMRK